MFHGTLSIVFRGHDSVHILIPRACIGCGDQSPGYSQCIYSNLSQLLFEPRHFDYHAHGPSFIRVLSVSLISSSAYLPSIESDLQCKTAYNRLRRGAPPLGLINVYTQNVNFQSSHLTLADLKPRVLENHSKEKGLHILAAEVKLAFTCTLASPSFPLFTDIV